MVAIEVHALVHYDLCLSFPLPSGQTGATLLDIAKGNEAIEVRHPGGGECTTDGFGMQDTLCCSGHHQLVSEFVWFCIHNCPVATVHAEIDHGRVPQIYEGIYLHAGTALSCCM